MPVRLVDAMAQAIYAYEGNKPPDRAYRNNNPGNLRLPPLPDRPVDEGGYTIFGSFLDGYLALVDDIRNKILGYNSYGLNVNSSLDDLFSVYAPASDDNDPHTYARFVSGWLSRTYNRDFVYTDTFEKILGDIGQSEM